MKKIVFIFILVLALNTHATTKEKVKLDRCVDGDTANFIVDGKEEKVRFIAIDTPETKHPQKGEEPWGKEASKFTCDSLESAKVVELEFDSDSEKRDKYDRLIAWVWVDGYLLQDELIKKGFAEVAYLYGDYKYTPLLQDHEAVAKANKVGKWSGENPSNFEEMIFNIAEDLLDKEYYGYFETAYPYISSSPMLVVMALIAFYLYRRYKKSKKKR